MYASVYINYNFHARDHILRGALTGRDHVPYSLGRELIIGSDSPTRRKQSRSNVYIRPFPPIILTAWEQSFCESNPP